MSVSIASLQRYSVEYDNVIRTLPHFTLEEIYQKFKMNVLEIDKTHKKVSFERSGTLLKPYSGSVTGQNKQEIGKVKEMGLTIEKSYISIWDNITNYEDVKVLSNAGEKVDNKTKKHPLEKQIFDALTKTVAEDVIFSMFPAERDTTNLTPLGAFDGYDTLVTQFISAGEISIAKGNLIESGEIVAPANINDVAALTAVVNWFKQLHPAFKRQKLMWIVPDAVLLPVLQALDNKHQARKVIDENDLKQYLRVHAAIPYLDIVNDPCLGTGQRMYVTVPGNMDFGVNTKTDRQFVQVLQSVEDPNDAHFWIQADFGCRWNHIHPKMFACNERAFVAANLSGDYRAAS
jgi:hypothetical protein